MMAASMNNQPSRSRAGNAGKVVADKYLVDGRYSITDLVDINRLRILFEEFSKTSGFTTGFVSFPGQEILIATGWRDACTKFHRSCAASSKACRHSNIFLTSCLRKQQELSIRKCSNGLVDGATPVIIRGKHLASVSTGQVFLEQPDLDVFARQARKYGYDEESYLAAIKKVPVVSEQQLKQTLRYLSGLAVFIAEEGLNAVRLTEENQLRRKSEEALVKGEDKYRRLFEGSMDAVLILNDRGRAIDCNDAAIKLFGFKTKQEILSRSPSDVSPKKQPDGRDSRVVAAEMIAIASKNRSHSFQWLNKRKDGTIFPVEARLSRLDVDGQTLFQTVVRDITERKQAEESMIHANRVLTTFDKCNSAILEAPNEMALYREICRIVVETGGCAMAWVGLVEHDLRKTVRPVASFGQSSDFFQREFISWADTPRGRGMAGTSIRTRKITVCTDFQKRRMAPSFVKDATKQKVNSAIGLPLIIGDECIGALSLYSSKPDAFGSGQQRMFEGFVKNLITGIVILRARAERERLQKDILLIGEQMQQRLGQELHDDLGQQLTGMSLIAGVVKQKLKASGNPMAEEVHDLLKMMTNASSSARALARGLYPVELDHGALLLSLEDLAAKTSILPGINCLFKNHSTGSFTKDQSIHLYRIAQEAVNNAIKHGRSKNISIEIDSNSKSKPGWLVVESDGISCETRRPENNGMGLRLMNYRAGLIGGTLEICKTDKGGCRVACTFPRS